MKDDDHRRKLEESEKETIIRVEILPRIEGPGCPVPDGWMVALKLMDKTKLQTLAQALGCASTQDAKRMTTRAISDFEVARRRDEQNESEKRCAAPGIDMDP
jgi:hypothetical protein